MRAISAAGLLLLAGCTSAVQQQAAEDILRPSYAILSMTAEPVVFAVGRGKGAPVEDRAPCQTNDPMPTGGLHQPPPAMPSYSGPSPVAPMPNYCPVTVPAAAKPTRVSTPRPPRRLQAPTPAEPQP